MHSQIRRNMPFHPNGVASLVILLLSSAIVLAESLQQTSSAWSYECKQNQCVKVPNTDSDNVVSLAVCRLLCPVDPGTVWPKVRGSIDLKMGMLAVINPDNIRLSAADVLHHEDFWPQNKERFLRQLRNKVPKSLVPTVGSGGQSMHINVQVARKDCKIWLQTDESYRIEATEVFTEGGAIEVVINASTIFGARHGLETLAQLVVFDDIRQKLMMPTDFSIVDAPAFQHRGLLLDTSRNFFSVESIKRTIGECCNKYYHLVFHN